MPGRSPARGRTPQKARELSPEVMRAKLDELERIRKEEERHAKEAAKAEKQHELQRKKDMAAARKKLAREMQNCQKEIQKRERGAQRVQTALNRVEQQREKLVPQKIKQQEDIETKLATLQKKHYEMEHEFATQAASAAEVKGKLEHLQIVQQLLESGAITVDMVMNASAADLRRISQAHSKPLDKDAQLLELREQNEQLREENEQLKALLEQHGIRYRANSTATRVSNGTAKTSSPRASVVAAKNTFLRLARRSQTSPEVSAAPPEEPAQLASPRTFGAPLEARPLGPLGAPLGAPATYAPAAAPASGASGAARGFQTAKTFAFAPPSARMVSAGPQIAVTPRFYSGQAPTAPPTLAHGHLSLTARLPQNAMNAHLTPRTIPQIVNTPTDAVTPATSAPAQTVQIVTQSTPRDGATQSPRKAGPGAQRMQKVVHNLAAKAISEYGQNHRRTLAVN